MDQYKPDRWMVEDQACLLPATGNHEQMHSMGLSVGFAYDVEVLNKLSRPLQQKHDRFQEQDCFEQ